MVCLEEKQRIRELAKRVAEIADLPVMEERRENWKRKNSLEHIRPMSLVYPEGAWRELIPASLLKCRSKKARELEWKLLARLYRYENFHDDFVMEKYWIVNKKITVSGWGLEPEFRGRGDLSKKLWDMEETLGYVPRVWDEEFEFNETAWGFEPMLVDYRDIEKIRTPEIYYDEGKTLKELEVVEELLDGVLKVKLKGITRLSFTPMNIYCKLRGLEQAMLDMYDEPEMLHETMTRFEKGYREMVDNYCRYNLLSPNNDETYIGSGGVGYTSELPQPYSKSDRIGPADLWAFAESQEMAQVSPQMHAEFVFPYEKRLLEDFGLSAYGCCEPLENKLGSLFTVKNLRRISVSPWANVQKCAEKIKDKYIFSYKPNPSMLAAGFSPEYIKETIAKSLEMTKNCIVEIILKDTHTCENQPERFNIWGKTLRELLSNQQI